MSALIPLGSLETSNTKLAAALTAVGIPLRENFPVRVLEGDHSSVCFFFQEKSECGQYHTVELIKAWDDRAWHLQNPEHPFAYLKVGFENQERLRDFARTGSPIGVVKKGSKIGFLNLHASDGAQRKFFQELRR